MEMEKSNCFVLRSHTTWQVCLSMQALLDSLVIVAFLVAWMVKNPPAVWETEA